MAKVPDVPFSVAERLGATALLMLAPLVLVLVGCLLEGEVLPCVASSGAGLTVVVWRGDTGDRLCDASVSAHQGRDQERLIPVGEPEACRYVSAREWSEDVSLLIEGEGFESVTLDDVPLFADSCHGSFNRLDVCLQPQQEGSASHVDMRDASGCVLDASQPSSSGSAM